jgi:hypothetical protein
MEIGNASKFHKSRDFSQDADFTPPLYNVWAFAKSTNEVKHFGNSEQRMRQILELTDHRFGLKPNLYIVALPRPSVQAALAALPKTPSGSFCLARLPHIIKLRLKIAENATFFPVIILLHFL